MIVIKEIRFIGLDVDNLIVEMNPESLIIGKPRNEENGFGYLKIEVEKAGSMREIKLQSDIYLEVFIGDVSLESVDLNNPYPRLFVLPSTNIKVSWMGASYKLDVTPPKKNCLKKKKV
jgi:hypothetical protein